MRSLDVPDSVLLVLSNNILLLSFTSRFSHFAKAGGEAYMMGNFATTNVSDADKVTIVVSSVQKTSFHN